MTDTLTIVSLLPGLQDTNGDAANARVLAQRARWAGFDAVVLDVAPGDALPASADIIVIGSGSDAALPAARAALLPMADRLRELVTAGVPLLAVGTGWELLGVGIDLADGSVVEGIGLVAGRAVPAPARIADDLAVKSKYGRLIGFENHSRHYVGAEGSPLGRVLAGTGNGNGQEGLVMGDVFGTHLHGPVLARNPGLADHLLRLALARRGSDYVPGARSDAVDETARAARNQVAVRLKLPAE
ncbi:type 1 glutamine amidotransferase [Cryobacterium tepidiphilum]|uniref:type 1 glutamine amidotransferase n=1 Tax=Cryobacterium tepidiphilum TaxID=2486026 RepID=UPI0013144465|nr:cobyric acid synthase [Cryobacterium tepidiphilum]